MKKEILEQRPAGVKNQGQKNFPLSGARRGGEKVIPAVLLSALFVFLNADQGMARTSILNGSVGLRQGYDSNVQRTKENEIPEWTTTLSPTVRITSEAEKDALLLTYSPGLVYNHRTDEERIDHNLSVAGNRQLASALGVSFRDTYVRDEDPYNDEESGILLADSRGRNRYWTNRFSTGFNYTYAKDSLLNLGYTHHVLDNDGENRQDFKKHNPALSMSYGFSPSWAGGISYAYTKGKFDQSDDLEQNDGGLSLTYLNNPHDKITGSYGISDMNYEGATRGDYTIHTPNLGWVKELDQKTSLSAAAGVAFVSRERGSDKEAFFYALGLRREIEKGAVSLNADGGFDQQQFNGTTTDGLSRYWSVRGSVNYQLLKDLAASISAKYREDDHLERVPEEKDKLYDTGAGLIYSFSKEYSLAVRYAYSRRDGENATRDYYDNRVFLELKGTADLFRWN